MATNIGDLVIVVATAGWSFVGTISGQASTDHLVLESASVIRVWGTKRGLGELALHGPTKDTILDPVGSVWIASLHALFVIPCKSRGAWDKRK